MEENNIPSEMVKPWIAARRAALRQPDCITEADIFDAGALWAARYCAEFWDVVQAKHRQSALEHAALCSNGIDCDVHKQKLHIAGVIETNTRAIRHAFGLTKEETK